MWGQQRILVLLLVAAQTYAQFGTWGPWSECSETCGMGMIQRQRSCLESGTCPPYGSVESKMCFGKPCPCGGELTEPSGSIKSPNYPDFYANNANCTWSIIPPPDHSVVLEVVDFHLQTSTECRDDHLRVSGVPLWDQKLCGIQLRTGDTEETTSNVIVQFVSDSGINDVGFMIDYKIITTPNCEGGDEYCYSGGTCAGLNSCICRTDFLGHRCSYVAHDPFRGEISVSSSVPTSEGVCSLYGLGHGQTFSGSKFDFYGTCQYVLSKTVDMVTDGSFEILVRMHKVCADTATSCVANVTISEGAEDKLVITEHGEVFTGGNRATLPTTYNHYMISETDNHISVFFDDHKLVADKKHFSIIFTPDESFTGELTGLCGSLDSTVSDDALGSLLGGSTGGAAEDFLGGVSPLFADYAPGGFPGIAGSFGGGALPSYGGGSLTTQQLLQSMVVDDNGEVCATPLDIDQKCLSHFSPEAESICNVLFEDGFADCLNHVNPVRYHDQCMQDLCQCQYKERKDCHCAIISEYSRVCVAAGGHVGSWRTPTSCARFCPGNQVFSECASSCPSSCENFGTGFCNRQCNEGCECPEDTFWSGSWCVRIEECPCTYEASKYEVGETRIQGHKELMCMGGKWSVKAVLPNAGVAVANGFGHFRTLDGSWFNFPGSSCQYLFAEHCGNNTSDFTIYITVEHCGSSSMFSCVRRVQIIQRGDESSLYVILGQNGEVLVQNHIHATLPTSNGDISVRRLSSKYVEVTIRETGVKLLWDERSTLILTVPETYKDEMCGLVGTYNSLTTDDFHCKNGLEGTPAVFGNSWKYPSTCEDVDPTSTPYDACTLFSQGATSAHEKCSVLRQSEFAACRECIPYEEYFKNCKQDSCACDTGNDCMCDVISLYAHQCLRAGIVVNWRNDTFCSKTCPPGQSYKANTTLCGRTCRSRMEPEKCTGSHIVEGCTCDDGLYLSNDGSCVELALCPCYVNQEWLPAGHVSHDTKNICTCSSGINNCRNTKSINDTLPITCPIGMNAKTCTTESERCDKVCNYLTTQTCPKEESCVPGCVCPGDLVRHGDKCVNETDCPCVFDGKEYQHGEIVFNGCERMTCLSGGQWEDDRSACSDQCKLAGGMSYTTFDGKRFDFRGACEYLLASDTCSESDFLYRITVKSRDCLGSNKAMCDTTVHIIFGSMELTLSVRKISGPFVILNRQDYAGTRFDIKDRGIYKVVYALADGRIIFKVMWDQKASVYLEMTSKDPVDHSTCGLCGIHDGNALNDFYLRNGALTQSALTFGNSWKILNECPDVRENLVDTCGTKRAWAQAKCRIMYDEFTECHHKVSPDYFYDKCVRETCSCDSGGDCECFCSSVADYALECGMHGITVEWRSSSVCPLMCATQNSEDKCVWRYEPKAPPCEKLCCNDTIVCPETYFEGCYPHCENDEVYDSETRTCMQREACNCTIIERKEPECQLGLGTNCSLSFFHPSTAAMTTQEVIDAANCEAVGRMTFNFTCEHPGFKEINKYTEGITCRYAEGFKLDTTNKSLAELTIITTCCECFNCSEAICDEKPTCQPHEELKSVKTECCTEYSCNCIGCLHNGTKKEPNAVWSEGCTTYSCVSDGEGCYEVNSSPHECLSRECPFYADKTYQNINKTEGECCTEPFCECKPEYEPAVADAFTCQHPKVPKINEYNSSDGLICRKAECVCPDDKNHCVDWKSCTSYGCDVEQDIACDCVVNSICKCNTSHCPPAQECGNCSQLIETSGAGIDGSVESCSNDTCCPKYRCDRLPCSDGSDVVCEQHQKKIRVQEPSDCCPTFECPCHYCVFNNETKLPGENWIHECTNYTCLSDGKDCFTVSAANYTCPQETCPYFTDRHPSVETTHEGCCDKLNCQCNAEHDPDVAENLPCEYPHIRNLTVLTEGVFTCKKAECVCPSNDSHCVVEANCTASGCYEASIHACNCAIERSCVCDRSSCPPPKPCDECYQPVEVPGSTSDAEDSCARSKCCPTYECLHVPCTDDGSSLECESYEKVETYNNGSCCPSYRCVCDYPKCDNLTCELPFTRQTVGRLNHCCEEYACSCTHCTDDSGTIHAEGDTWAAPHDPLCITQSCYTTSSGGCPSIDVRKNKRDVCPTKQTCESYEDATLYATDSCCYDNNCTCNESKCTPSPSSCSFTETMLTNEALTNDCCHVTCCAAKCVDNGRHYGPGEVWNNETCMPKKCVCDGCHCETRDVEYECPDREDLVCPPGKIRTYAQNPENPCCPSYECQCLCLAFGDPHYLAFDQNYYDFQGKCHYTLVKERVSDRFHVYTDNSNCTFMSPDVSCVKRVYVEWEETVVMLYHIRGQRMHQAVFVNGTVLTGLPWSSHGISITMYYGRIEVAIAEINLRVIYNGNGWFPSVLVLLPMERFFNETVGLCGSCTNETSSIFEMSNQSITTNATEFGASWFVEKDDEDVTLCIKDIVNKPDCTLTRHTTGGPEDKCCPCANQTCSFLSSSVWDECSNVVDVKPMQYACETDGLMTCMSGMDACNACNSSSVETLSEMCEDEGVCVKWRKAANCPEPTCGGEGMVHRECEPKCMQALTCDNYKQPMCVDNSPVSGCFCQEGFVLKTAGSNKCVPIECCGGCDEPTCSTSLCDMVSLSNDSCGCTVEHECVCNTARCDETPTCDNCSSVQIYPPTPNNDTCQTCCNTEVCEKDPCVPDYTIQDVPFGYVLEHPPGTCCPVAVCNSCELMDGNRKLYGATWQEEEDGCVVHYMCGPERHTNSCAVIQTTHNTRDDCPTKQEFNDCYPDEYLKESPSGNTCCVNYTCTCNSSHAPTPIECNAPGQFSKTVKTIESRCFEKPVCDCDTETPVLQRECASYAESVANCSGRADRSVVRVQDAPQTGPDPCCPQWVCECDPCYNQTRPECPPFYEAIDISHPSDCCRDWKCVCNSCQRRLNGEDYVLKPYENATLVNRSSNCEIGVYCLPTRLRNEEYSCHEMRTVYEEEDNCLTKEQYEDLHCNLTGSYAVEIESTGLCCQRYKCECPPCESPNCGSHGSKMLITGPRTACCPTEYCNCTYNDISYCPDEFLVHTPGVVCPPCECPEGCNHTYANCTEYLGCHVEVIEQDFCGCPIQSDCKCNPNLCPRPPACGSCQHLTTVTNSSESIHDQCHGCCDVYQCVTTPCEPDYDVIGVPEGYELYQNSSMCCPVLICAACFWEGEVIKPGGNISIPDEGGCIVEHVCSDERYTNSCHILNEAFNPRTKCKTQDEYECKEDQKLVEASSTDPCCANYTCVCNPDYVPPPIECENGSTSIVVPAKGSVCAHSICVCLNDTEEYKNVCPGYEEEWAKCQNTSIKEFITEHEKKQCCPHYHCRCKTCSPEIEPAVCPEYYGPYTYKDECDCYQEGCTCIACKDSTGKYRNFFETWNETDSSASGCTNHECDPYKKPFKPDDECYQPSVLPCPFVDKKPGHILVEDNCCYLSVCNDCFHRNGSVIAYGETWQEEEDGCVVHYECGPERHTNSCAAIQTTHNTRDDCPTKQEFDDCYPDEYLKESPSGNTCCVNYTCTCNSSHAPTPIECNAPGQFSKTVKTIESRCFEKPVCDCDTETPVLRRECASYAESVANCSGRADRSVVRVQDAPQTGPDPCCPQWICECDSCYNQTRPECPPFYEAIDISQPSDCCRDWKCICNSCQRRLNGEDYVLKPYENATLVNRSSNCEVGVYCLPTRLRNDVYSCHEMRTVYEEEDNCLTKEQYEDLYCNLTGTYAVEIESTGLCCQRYKCECPPCESPICGAEGTKMLITGTRTDCCPTEYCNCTYNDILHCPDEFLVYTPGVVCPDCVCPIGCNHTYANCTEYLGCHVEVIEQDFCGCPIQSECKCNPNLCPRPPACGSCQHLTTVTNSSESIHDQCHGCCDVYQCVTTPCEPDYDVIGVPEGYELYQNSSMCCPVLICAACFWEGEVIKPGGNISIPDEGGCIVEHVCSDERYTNSCHILNESFNPRTKCKTQDQYECKEDEKLVEASSTDPCCANYTCVCNPEYVPPPIECENGSKSIVVPAEASVCAHSICVCLNDTEEYKNVCPGYEEELAKCQNTSIKEFITEHVEKQCCPQYHCTCKTCSPEIEPAVCPEYYGPYTYKDECDCYQEGCTCIACKDSTGKYRNFFETWNETDSSASGCTNHECDPYKKPFKPDDECYQPSVLPCPFVDKKPGHILVEDNCCYLSVCNDCFHRNGSVIAYGETWQEEEDGCVVHYECGPERHTNSCAAIQTTHNTRDDCPTKQEFDDCYPDEYLKESPSGNTCCVNYTCTCNSSHAPTPIECNAPGQFSKTVKTIESRCFEKPVCDCDTETPVLRRECASYAESVANCSGRADRSVVRVQDAPQTGPDPCCPQWICECDSCYNQTRPECPPFYEAIDISQPSDCCRDWKCICNSCQRRLNGEDYVLKPYENATLVNRSSNCEVGVYCLPTRLRNDVYSCHEMRTVYEEEDNCLTKEQYEDLYCNLTGTYAVEIESTGLCCQRYKCECPPCESPICGAEGTKMLITGTRTDCCPTEYCNCTYNDILHCPDEFLVYTPGVVCPDCVCPIGCNHTYANCTEYLGCHVEVIEQDFCGCPIQSECKCNPNLCPRPPACGSCQHLTTVTNSSESIHDQCHGCCDVYQCVTTPCEPDYDVIGVPEGYELYQNSSMCCPVLICAACFWEGEVIKPGGNISIPDEGGCIVEHVCSDERYTNSCHILNESFNPRTKCKTQDQYECKEDEKLVEASSTDPCCANYTCVCNPEYVPPPIECENGSKSIVVPAEASVCAHSICVCLNDTEEYKNVCPGYEEELAKCQNTSIKEFITEHVEKQCCPQYHCTCKTCSPEIEPAVCPEYYGPYTYKDECDCYQEGCTCIACKDSTGKYRHFFETWNQTDSSGGGCTNYECNPYKKPFKADDECYQPSVLPCPFVDEKPGHILVEDNCCYLSVCNDCFHRNGSVIAYGETWQEKVDGCVVHYECGPERHTNSCAVIQTTHNTRDDCPTKQEFDDCYPDEYLRESPSGNTCCVNYTCTCNSSHAPTPIECNAPCQFSKTIKTIESRCFEKPVCDCDTETPVLRRECASYAESVANCSERADRSVVRVQDAPQTGPDPCCPQWICECDPCYNQTRPECPPFYEAIDMSQPSDCCRDWKCVCNSCQRRLNGEDYVLKPYENATLVNRSSNCEIGVYCLPTRLRNDVYSCHEMRTVYEEEDNCLTKEQYEDLYCNLTGSYAVEIESTGLCCQRYKCECPPCESPNCGAHGSKMLITGPRTACCPTEYCNCTYNDISYCPDEFISYTPGVVCPDCPCPEVCNHTYANCTEYLGCHVEVTEQDFCGCPIQSDCKCNPNLCPQPPACGRCQHLTTVTNSSESIHDQCHGCCDVYQCVTTPCDPDYDVIGVPEGYELYLGNNKCCPIPKCNACLWEAEVIKPGGFISIPDEGGCIVEHVCSDEKYTNSCHILNESFNPRNNCKTRDQYECKEDEKLVEASSTDPCCANYTCVCNPEYVPPPIECENGSKSIVVPAEASVCAHSICVCLNDTEEYKNVCPGYEEELAKCQNTSIKEFLTIHVEEQCCPHYHCICKACSPEIEPAVCREYYGPYVYKDECDCYQEGCTCIACKDSTGKYQNFFETWNETDSSASGCTNYECNPYKKPVKADDECYQPSVLPCPFVDEKPGHILVEDNCCYLSVCNDCFQPNGSVIPYGATWQEKEDGCAVHYQCGPERLNNSCARIRTTYNGKDECKPEPECLPYENKTEFGSTECCTNYICECREPDYSPTPPACNEPAEIVTSISNENNTCYQCTCNDDRAVLEAQCPGYNETLANCTGPRSRVEVDLGKISELYKCCPEYKCTCDGGTVDSCKDGYKILDVRDVGDTCPLQICSCDSCVLQNGTLLARGSKIDIPDQYGCVRRSLCSNDRLGILKEACFQLKEVDQPKCLTKEQYETQTCKEHEHAVELYSGVPQPCCVEYNCTCNNCSDDYKLYPDVIPNACEMFAFSTLEENPLQKCCPTYKVICNETAVTPVPECPENHYPVQLSEKDPETNGCCNKYVCRCDVCELDGGVVKNVDDTWTETVLDGCNVTWQCSLMRQNETNLETCHVAVRTRDPRDNCLTQSEYGEKNCQPYEFAVDSIVDSDRCCDDYECKCQGPEVLETICTNFTLNCSEYKEVKTFGNQPGTHDCCPNNECVCRDEKELQQLCKQWDDYTCPAGYKRVTVVQRNPPSGPCCPEYVCECESCVHENGIFPPNTTFALQNDNCQVAECVIDETTECPKVVTKDKHNCEPFNETECRLCGGSQVISDCCLKCDCGKCSKKVKNFTLSATLDGQFCWTPREVDVSVCEGPCTTLRGHNVLTGEVEGGCKCCKETSTLPREYPMVCVDDVPRVHSYAEVVGCECGEVECDATELRSSNPVAPVIQSDALPVLPPNIAAP